MHVCYLLDLHSYGSVTFFGQVPLHANETVYSVFKSIHIITVHKLRLFQIKTNLNLLSVAFLLSWLPYATLSMLAAYGSQESISPMVPTLCAVFAKMSVVWNPLVYMGRSREFRRELHTYLNRNQGNVIEPSKPEVQNGNQRQPNVGPVNLEIPQARSHLEGVSYQIPSVWMVTANPSLDHTPELVPRSAYNTAHRM